MLRERSPEQLRAYVSLLPLSGQDFDKAYMDNNADAHAKDVQQLQGACAAIADADVQAFVNASLLPALTAHLDPATQIDGRLNSSGQ